MNRAMILGIVGVISLVWGIYDLRTKGDKHTPTTRIQSWGQIIAGTIAILFSLLNWIK